MTDNERDKRCVGHVEAFRKVALAGLQNTMNAAISRFAGNGYNRKYLRKLLGHTTRA
jgi:hypothetical protein